MNLTQFNYFTRVSNPEKIINRLLRLRRNSMQSVPPIVLLVDERK
jgi:hypothetical protein